MEAMRREVELAAATSVTAAGAEPLLIGRITAMEAAWSFCTIAPAKNAPPLVPGASLFALPGGAASAPLDLTLTRIAGRSLIVDYGTQPAAANLRLGDPVYQWTVPPATR